MKTFIHSILKQRLPALALAAGLLWGAQAQAGMAGDEIVIPVNRSELITVPVEVAEVITAEPRVADVYVHGKNSVSIIGESVGVTTIRIFDELGKVARDITVRVTYDLPAIRQSLYQLFPYEDIAVETVNTNLVLTGMVSTPAVAQKAVIIANEFMTTDSSRLQNTAQSTAERSRVINMLKVTSGQQVMLRVRIGEVQRNALKRLGFNWQAINEGAFAFTTGSLLNTLNVLGTTQLVDQDTGNIVGLSQPVVMGPDGSQIIQSSQTNTFGQFMGGHQIGSTRLTAMLEALEQNNLLKLMAEPNIVAMSGEEAEFLSGGEFPIPFVSEDSVTIEYRQYGVAVRFRPVVLSDSRIRLSVSPEVSELTDLGSIELNNISIPALTTRRARTTVELAPGESFMIAGLLKDQSDASVSQLPGVSEIPFLSGLFRDTTFERNETELVIAVTPYLVSPTTGKDLRLPTDRMRPASMMEQFFYGALGSIQNGESKLSQTPPLEGPIGFMVD